MAIMSSSSKTIGALMMTLALATVAVAARRPPPPGVSTTTTTNLTLHNLCPYPVWPLVTPNAGVPSVPTDADGEPEGRLDGNGEGLATLAFPPGPWSGRVVARTGCTDGDDVSNAYGDWGPLTPFRCATGDAPPVTVAQVSVSLVDGFNVAVVVTPHGMPPEDARRERRCPTLTLGCAVDLALRVPCCGAGAWRGGCGAGATEAALFKQLCPDTRTNATDVEVTPQDCVDPGEIMVVFCPKPDSVVAGHL